jgi:hypothetical protein
VTARRLATELNEALGLERVVWIVEGEKGGPAWGHPSRSHRDLTVSISSSVTGSRTVTRTRCRLA